MCMLVVLNSSCSWFEIVMKWIEMEAFSNGRRNPILLHYLIHRNTWNRNYLIELSKHRLHSRATKIYSLISAYRNNAPTFNFDRFLFSYINIYLFIYYNLYSQPTTNHQITRNVKHSINNSKTKQFQYLDINNPSRSGARCNWLNKIFNLLF